MKPDVQERVIGNTYGLRFVRNADVQPQDLVLVLDAELTRYRFDTRPIMNAVAVSAASGADVIEGRVAHLAAPDDFAIFLVPIQEKTDG
jgi:hypothetical protein